MRYDFGLPEQDYALSHARAYSLHSDFSLLGAADPEPALRQQFTERYKTAAYASVAGLLAAGNADVIVIASPTDTHLAIVREVLQGSTPRLILCEKPLAYSESDATEMERLCRERDVLLFVNYIRRADPAVIEVKRRLDTAQIVAPFKAVVWYSKGLLHNGSHFLDLLAFWFGPVQHAALICAGENRGEQDAEPDFRLGFTHGSAIFCAAREENFSHYTVEIVAANGRLRYEQGGVISWQSAGQHPTLEHYRQLQKPGEEIANDMDHYQFNVASQISHALQGKIHTLCDGATGVANIRLLTSLLNEREKH